MRGYEYDFLEILMNLHSSRQNEVFIVTQGICQLMWFHVLGGDRIGPTKGGPILV